MSCSACSDVTILGVFLGFKEGLISRMGHGLISYMFAKVI